MKMEQENKLLIDTVKVDYRGNSLFVVWQVMGEKWFAQVFTYLFSSLCQLLWHVSDEIIL